MAEPYQDTDKYNIFFFEGSMPNSLDEIPFDYTSFADIAQNSVSFNLNYEPKVLSRSTNESVFAISKKDPVNVIADHDNGLNPSTANQVPVAWMGYATGGDNTTDPLTTQVDFSTATTLNELNSFDNPRDRSSADNYYRVGREGSFVVVDFGADPIQEFSSRQYYYVTESADDLFLDDTVFVYHLSALQTNEPGVYDNTFVFAFESSELNEYNQTVTTRTYDVDLIAGGTAPISISYIRNNSYVALTGAPRISPELVVDTGNGFLEHTIPTQNIPLLLHGYTLRQRTIGSRQKRPSWSGSNSYSTRSTVGRLDVWDADSSTWTTYPQFSTNSNNYSQEFVEPISASRYVRFVCVDGPILNGYVLVSGDPHFSLGHLALFTKTTDIQYSNAIMDVDLTWALVVPQTETFDANDPAINGTQDYSDVATDMAPVILCDVGLTGSNAAIELAQTNYMSLVNPNITKMNLKFID